MHKFLCAHISLTSIFFFCLIFKLKSSCTLQYMSRTWHQSSRCACGTPVATLTSAFEWVSWELLSSGSETTTPTTPILISTKAIWRCFLKTVTRFQKYRGKLINSLYAAIYFFVFNLIFSASFEETRYKCIVMFWCKRLSKVVHKLVRKNGRICECVCTKTCTFSHKFVQKICIRNFGQIKATNSH